LREMESGLNHFKVMEKAIAVLQQQVGEEKSRVQRRTNRILDLEGRFDQLVDHVDRLQTQVRG
jgi:hypothetical protein